MLWGRGQPVGRVIRAVAVGLGVAAALLVAAPSLAASGGLHTLAVPGVQSSIRCLSARLCVVGGFDVGRPHGAVFGQIRNRSHVHLNLVAGSEGVFDLSCPNASGCVALALGSGTLAPIFVTTNRLGVPVKRMTAKLAPSVTGQRLSCTSLTSCVVAGTDARHSTYQVGTWDGRKVVLHTVPMPSGTSGGSLVDAVTCVGPTCQVVGYVGTPTSDDGIIITTSHGRPVAFHRVPNHPLFALSCTSATDCVAAASDPTSVNGDGTIVTLHRGAPTGVTDVAAPTVLAGIACRGRVCEVVGQHWTAAGLRFVGALYRFSAGDVSGPQLVRTTREFVGVSLLPGGGFATIGIAGTNSSLFANG